MILQSARHVQSEEARTSLRDAHSRVMSVATLQQQLAASRLGGVVVRDYFTQLCESIGASMIRDPDHLVLEVDADATLVTADTSVSLGLVVTELVINCLKHAFPGGRPGRIVVRYRSDGSGWTLRVTDNGVGPPAPGEDSSAGLGTSIVTALAHQLRARILVTDATPGMSVALVHAAASPGEPPLGSPPPGAAA